MALAAAVSGEARGEACALQDGAIRAVAAVLDGETLRLDDGSELRLAGILAPRAADAASDATFWPPAQDARSALERLVGGRSIQLAGAERAADRYGRQIGHAFLLDRGRRIWLQGALLADGHARVYAHSDRAACLDEMTSLERTAHVAGRGLWGNAAYQVRQADDTFGLMRYRHTLQIVEGRIAAVAEVRGQVFFNFGADWRTDFTAGIERPRQGGWSADLKALEGVRVRVRGFIERRNGPYVALVHASQLEVVQENAQEAAAPRRTASRRSRTQRHAEPSSGGAPAANNN